MEEVASDYVCADILVIISLLICNSLLDRRFLLTYPWKKAVTLAGAIL